jgi:hypothetical protein
MTASLTRWLIALTLASLAMGLVLAHAAYAGERPAALVQPVAAQVG